jgi:ankyrin repeat protein
MYMYFRIETQYTFSGTGCNWNKSDNMSIDDSREDTLENLYIDAARDGNLDRLIELLNMGANELTWNKDCWTALHFASSGGHLDVVQYLIEQRQLHAHGIEQSDTTPLHLACREGHLEVVKYLSSIEECQFGIEDKNTYGLTALLAACIHHRIEVVKYLIHQWHVNINAIDNRGFTALHYASQNSGDLELVQYLTNKCHLDVEIQDYYGETALHKAISDGNMLIVQYLIEEYHADIAVTNNNGENVLDLAYESKEPNSFVIYFLQIFQRNAN